MQYNIYGTNIWKSLGDFLLDHYSKNMIEGVPHTRGHTPYLSLGWYKIFVAVIHILDITYLSKCFNHSETHCKMIKFRDTVERTGTTYRCLQT